MCVCVCVKGDTLTTSHRRQRTIYVANKRTSDQCGVASVHSMNQFVCAANYAHTFTVDHTDTHTDMNLSSLARLLVLHAPTHTLFSTYNY